MRTMLWTLVVPLKPLAVAKSRLAPAAGGLRPGLALAFAQDTVAAAADCAAVGGVLVVTDDPTAGAALAALGAEVVPDEPAAGLNAALRHGARRARAGGRPVPVAALSADLPALRARELQRVLEHASEHGRSFLPDAAGTGTTLLAASPGHALRPLFGGASRAAHRASGAEEITAADVDSVRRDVDTAEDLRAALLLGVGPHSATLAGMQATAYTYSAETRSGSVLLDDGTPVPFDAAAFDAGGLRLLRPGQRVRIRTEGEGGDRRVVFLTLQTFPDPV